jgi:hypothetical protein
MKINRSKKQQILMQKTSQFIKRVNGVTVTPLKQQKSVFS